MSTKPTKCISVEEARELHDQWNNSRAGDMKKNLGFEDTREFHWTVDELQEYLDYVKDKSKILGVKKPGIRVYLGAYPKHKCKKGKGLSTVFFAPTGAKPGGLGKDGLEYENNYDIEPFNLGGAGDPPNNY